MNSGQKRVRCLLSAVCCLLRRGRCTPASYGEDRENAKGDIGALWQQVTSQPGLVTAYVLANAEDGRDGLVMSIWESEEAFDAYAATTLRAEVEAVGALDRKNYYVLRATI